MSLASSLKKVAGKTIKRFGGDVTIRYVTEGSYNTTTGAITRTTSDVTIKGVLEDVNQREVNELIRASDKRLTVAANALTTAPETNDLVVIGSVVHEIIEIKTQEQDNTAITYELVLRA
jgi:PKD repeat protein